MNVWSDDVNKESQQATIKRLCDGLNVGLGGAVKQEEAVIKKERYDSFELEAWNQRLWGPMLEVLNRPRLLFSAALAAAFTRALVKLHQQGCSLVVGDKLPGVYLLLVHPDQQVQHWATKTVQQIGPVHPDEYNNLDDVISWMLAVIDPDVSAPDLLPAHLFVKDSPAEFWQGVATLVFHLEADTVRRKLMSQGRKQPTLLLPALNAIRYANSSTEGPSPFWPALQCVTTLMEKLGSRTWFQLSPSELFLAVTEHPTYQSEIAKWDGYHGDRGPAPAHEWCVSSGQSSEPLTRGGSVPSAQPRKASLAWFMPFVHSLLNFGTLYKDCVSHVIYHVHRLSGKSVRGSLLWLAAEEILVRSVHEVLANGLADALRGVSHVWIPHIASLCAHEHADIKSVRPLMLAARRVTGLVLREVRWTQASGSLPAFIWRLRDSDGHETLALRDDQRRELVSVLRRHFEGNAALGLKENTGTRGERKRGQATATSGCLATDPIVISDDDSDVEAQDNPTIEEMTLPPLGKRKFEKKVALDSSDDDDLPLIYACKRRKVSWDTDDVILLSDSLGKEEEGEVDVAWSEGRSSPQSADTDDDDAWRFGASIGVASDDNIEPWEFDGGMDDLHATHIDDDSNETPSPAASAQRNHGNVFVGRFNPSDDGGELYGETRPIKEAEALSLDFVSGQFENPGLSDMEMYWGEEDLRANLADEIVGPVQGKPQTKRTPGSAGQLPATEPSKAISVDDFLRDVLQWNPGWLFKETEKNQPAINGLGTSVVAPLSFDSMDSYCEAFRPLLLAETWEQIARDWKVRRKSPHHVTAKCEAAWLPGNFLMVRCFGDIGPDQAVSSRHPLESDLVIISVASGGAPLLPGHPRYVPSVFGFVNVIEKTPIKGGYPSTDTGSIRQQSYRLSLTLKTCVTYQFPRDSSLQIEAVTSLLSTLRQWCGLVYLRKSLLAVDILSPRRLGNFGLRDYVGEVVASQEYNLSQERVMHTVTEAVHQPYPLPRICLVQGPPGTGKSHTIAGLISRILNHPKSSHVQGPDAGGQTRVLLCAPSNGAIDELVRRLVTKGPRLKNKSTRSTSGGTASNSFRNCGDFTLVRVGRKSHIHPSVAELSLDNLARVPRLEGQEVLVTQLKDEIKRVERKLHQLDKLTLLDNAASSAKPVAPTKGTDVGQTERTNLMQKKSELETRYSKARSSVEQRKRCEGRMRREIMRTADIVCCTLNGSGTKMLSRDAGAVLAGQLPFTCVIVDEACQACELDILIPLQLGSSKLVLVGDPEQLPATVFSRKAKEMMFGRSMFERLYRFFRNLKKEQQIERPVLMLDVQYRMHPEIARFPADYVYSRRLLNDSSLKDRRFPLKTHYAFFDVVNGREVTKEHGCLWNREEVELVVELCADLEKILKGKSVGIITPYQHQKTQLEARLRDRIRAKIEVNTVDGFQGREKDVILLSCVRAKSFTGSIGFLANTQRMNVALTRACHALYVFGHCATLKSNKDWRALIKDAENRRLLFTVKRYSDIRQRVLGEDRECQSQEIDSTSRSGTDVPQQGGFGEQEANMEVSSTASEPFPTGRGCHRTATVVSSDGRPATSFPEDAQQVIERIKARHPPSRGPEVIQATKELIGRRWRPHGGPRERRAQARAQDVEDIRERGPVNAAHSAPAGRAKPKRRTRKRPKTRDALHKHSFR